MASLNSYTYRFELKNDDIIIERGDQRLRLKISEVLTHPLQLANLGLNTEEINKLVKEIKNQLKNKPLRKTFEFNYTTPIYVKMTPPTIVDGELVGGLKKEWILYLAYKDVNLNPILILDRDGFIKFRKFAYSLKSLSKEEIKEILTQVPREVFKRILKVGEQWGYNLTREKSEDDEAFLDRVAASLEKLFFSPTVRLKDPSILNNINWAKVIDEVTVPGGINIDFRLKIIRKCTLLRGLKQQTNPHTLIILPGGCGKSDWYKIIGNLKDKTTFNSLIGYATADEGIRFGSIHDAELPIALDQILEQSMLQIFKYLFNILEFGEAVVDTAARPFKTWCQSIFIVLGNPSSSDTPSKDFLFILRHLSYNPSFGRRLGIILYDPFATPLEKREKNLASLMGDYLILFRSVEEYARKELLRIINEEKVWNWLNIKNKDWIISMKNAIQPLKEEYKNIYLFLQEFIENGWTHIRGAALYAALVDKLNQIALKQYDLNEILDLAEEYLTEVLKINTESIIRIVGFFEESRELFIRRIYDTLPRYVKYIISAIELVKRKMEKEKVEVKLPLEILLVKIPYQPPGQKYLSKIIYDILRRGNPTKHNRVLKDVFGFELKEINNNLIAIIHNLNPILEIEPEGSLSDISDISDILTRKNISKTEISEKDFSDISEFSDKVRGKKTFKNDSEKKELLPPTISEISENSEKHIKFTPEKRKTTSTPLEISMGQFKELLVKYLNINNNVSLKKILDWMISNKFVENRENGIKVLKKLEREKFIILEQKHIGKELKIYVKLSENGEIIEWLNNALKDNPWMDLLSRKDVSQKAVKWGKRGNGEINRNKMESLPPSISENSEKSEKLRLRDLNYTKFLELMEKNVLKYLSKIPGKKETLDNLANMMVYYKPWRLIGLSFNNIVEAEDFLKRLCNQNKIKIELGEDNKYWVTLCLEN